MSERARARMERGRRLLSASEVPLTSNSNALRPSLSKHFRSERQHSPSVPASVGSDPPPNKECALYHADGNEWTGNAALSPVPAGALPAFLSFSLCHSDTLSISCPIKCWDVGSGAVTVGNYPPDETGGRGDIGGRDAVVLRGVDIGDTQQIKFI